MNIGTVADSVLIQDGVEISTRKRTALFDYWEFTSVPPGAMEIPSDTLRQPDLNWLPAMVPGTVASSLRSLGHLSEHDEFDFDAQDHWYRCTFSTAPDPGRVFQLYFGGLATLADVWLNDVLIVSAENMFLAYACDVTQLLNHGDGSNRLSIRFRSLSEALDSGRPRAKWRTGMVSDRNLRFYRTTLLGRMPGICPGIAPAGPWRNVEIIEDQDVRVGELLLRSRLEGGQGVVDVWLSVLGCRDGAAFSLDYARLQIGESVLALSVAQTTPGEASVTGEMHIVKPKIWWPHTHGEPYRYIASINLGVDGRDVTIRIPPIGFRTVELEGQAGAEFVIRINGVPVFCRGTCWSPVDLVSLNATDAELRQTLELVRNAGMNMLRVSGSMVYESSGFYDLCDELGILVWQDFMFARMDYPVADSNFAANIESEAKYQLARFANRPSICVLCGNSEVQQQAAMLGLPEDLWRNEWFDEQLPALCHLYRPDVPYWPSSPSGGSMPFYTDAGISHCFGVGGYSRPIQDARTFEPNFASECLAFSIVPEPESISLLAEQGGSILSLPAFRNGIPSDAGSDWDFADVTDHYISEIFQVDPQALKHDDEERYLSVARAAVGEVMEYVQSTWRRNGSRCSGALIWLHRDYTSGAGWGIVDCNGIPKAPYYYLKRVWSPIALLVIDDGLNGIRLHLANDTIHSYKGYLDIRFIRYDGTIVLKGGCEVECGARQITEVPVESVTGMFMDSSYSYRFGGRNFDYLVARYHNSPGVDSGLDTLLVESIYRLPGTGLLPETDVGFCVRIVQGEGNRRCLKISSSKFAQTVSLSVPGYSLSDNYFHLTPHVPRFIELKAYRSGSSGMAYVHALNSKSPAVIDMEAADIDPESDPAGH